MAPDIAAKGYALPPQFKAYVELLKLRIGFMIALSAVMGYVAISKDIVAAELATLVVAMICASSSASVFNHVWDRDIDGLMNRTMNRPLVTGTVSGIGYPLVMSGALLVAGMGIAASVFNLAVAVHLFLGAFFYAIVYTVWLKRRTWLNIVIGGAAGSFAVLAGAAAVDPEQWKLPLLLAAVLFLWTPSHFWALAIMLKEDYAKAKVPMLPVLFGEAVTAKAIFFNSLLMVLAAALPWMIGELGTAYAVLSCLLGLFLMWGNWRLIQTPNRLWARRNFFGSMQYLAGLFLAVLIDVNWV